MKVGIIALGRMGVGMAANLLKAGHEVAVYNRTAAKAETLIAQGARAATNVSDACRGDAVITMLANDEALASVVLGEGGVVASLAAGAVHVSSSTISVALSERLAETHRKAGQRYVAAPVFGRPSMAAAGQLFVIAATRRRSKPQSLCSKPWDSGPSSFPIPHRPPISSSSAAIS